MTENKLDTKKMYEKPTKKKNSKQTSIL